MVEKANCKTKVIVDASDPNGVLGRTLEQSKLTEVLEILEEIKRYRSFEIEVFAPSPKEVLKLSKIHLGKAYVETHCFRGYPVHASIRQFHNHESEYILHLDCDMIFHESPEYSWIKDGISLMEQNADILCVLPRGGPPTENGSLHQGSTLYKVDKKRNAYLFKNFTSRHYLVHRKRFLELLPIKPLWLSWRTNKKHALWKWKDALLGIDGRACNEQIAFLESRPDESQGVVDSSGRTLGAIPQLASPCHKSRKSRRVSR